MTRETSFLSAGARCAADHHPGEGDAFAGPAGRPCVVMAHGFGATRDSGLEPFARAFAAAGLDVLLFDFRGFGGSEGPAQDVSFRRQREDFHAAVAHARGLDGVDPERIVLWGTSYSGGHVIAVGADDPRVAAVVSQVPSTDGRVSFLAAVRAGGPRQLVRFTTYALRDVVGGLAGRPHHVAVVGEPGARALMTSPDAAPGYFAIAGPSFRNEVRARTALEVPLNRPVTKVAQLRCPLLVQIADEDVVTPPAAARRAAALAPGRAEVRSYPVGHFDVYQPPWRDRVIEDALHFLRRHVGAEAGTTRGAGTTA